MRWGLAVVRGVSMTPTLREGDRVLVAYPGSPQSGEVAIVRLPPTGVVAIKRLDHRVPGGWWVARDNSEQGVDSWQVGAVPDQDVLGVVLLRLWPAPGVVRRRQ